MVYLMSFHSRWLMATMKSFVGCFSLSGISSRSFLVRRLTSPIKSRRSSVRYLVKAGREPAFALERREFVVQRRVVGEGKFLRARFEEKIERIQHRHLRDQIHFDAKFARRLLEHQARGIVGLRILLPVDEMFFRP